MFVHHKSIVKEYKQMLKNNTSIAYEHIIVLCVRPIRGDSWLMLQYHTGCSCSWTSGCNLPCPTTYPNCKTEKTHTLSKMTYFIFICQKGSKRAISYNLSMYLFRKEEDCFFAKHLRLFNRTLHIIGWNFQIVIFLKLSHILQKFSILQWSTTMASPASFEA